MNKRTFYRSVLGSALLLSTIVGLARFDRPVAVAAVPTWIPRQVNRIMLAQSNALSALPPGSSVSGSDLVLPGNLQIPSGSFIYTNGASHSQGISGNGSTLDLFGSPVRINNDLSIVGNIAQPSGGATLNSVTASSYLVSSGILYPRGNTVTDDNAATLTFNDSVADGASAVAFSFNSSNTLSTTAAVMEWKNNTTSKAKMLQDGYLASTTPHTLTSAYLGAAGTLLVAGTTYGGHVVGKPFTVTDLTLYVGTASTATVANTVFTITDGTNTCTATFACNTSTNSSGAKTAATANGAGTGCVYAASAALSFSVTTQGCATAATVKNIDIVGKWQ